MKILEGMICWTIGSIISMLIGFFIFEPLMVIIGLIGAISPLAISVFYLLIITIIEKVQQ